MDAARFQLIKDIFAEAAELDAAERAAFVRARCGRDDALAADVESLLAAHEEPENLIERNAFSLAENLDANGGRKFARNDAGKRFGNYEVVREIGRGGMGAVFLAGRADGEFRQTVALKIIRQAILDDETERRFRREREILASLNHPNIARLYDGGVSEAGEAFLAMEYVEGEALNEYAEARNLSVEARLLLFQKICAAVAYAHRNLTVHRDLKPSNILVTADGEPKLLDFGLARMTEEGSGETGAEPTETVLRAFTPAYASPEQILGRRITTSSDIYSLGVILYELLSGAKPFRFDGKSLEEIVRTMTASEPVPPSSVRTSASPPAPRLNADLDNIALKALQKEPERRYETVEALSDDISRHLAGRPVHARPASYSYRAAKFFRRNRIAVSAAAVILLSVVAGVAVALWQANETRKERDRAERRFRDVRQLSNSLLFEIAPKIENFSGSTEAREMVVRRALEYLDSLAGEAQSDPKLQSELAAAYEKIGDLQGNPTNPNLIELDAAVKSYEKARDIRRALMALAPSDTDARRSLAENARVLGNILGQTNNPRESFESSTAAREIYAQLAAEDPGAAEFRYALAKVDYDLGLNLQTNKNYADSLAYFDAAKKSLGALVAADPSNREYRRALVEAKIQNANALSWNEEQRAAEAEAAEAVESAERLAAAAPDDLAVRGALWLSYWLTSGIYQDQDNAKSYEFAVKAADVITQTVARDGANLRAKQQFAKSYSKLGETATLVGKPAEAIAYLEKATRMLREITAATTRNLRLKSDLALSVRRLGSAKAELGRFADALADFGESVELFRALLADQPDDRRSNRNLADTYEQIAKTHEKLFVKSGSDAERRAAAEGFGEALEILSRLEQTSALAVSDRKFLDETRANVKKYAR